jgi:hypothetical protein
VSARVVAVSDNAFERSLLLSLLAGDHCTVTLLDAVEDVARVAADRGVDVLVVTEQVASRGGAAMFDAVTQARGAPAPLLVLNRRGAEGVVPAWSPHQVVLPFPCERSAMAASVQFLASAAPVPFPSPPGDLHAALRSRVGDLFRLLPGIDHYALLGVSPACSDAEVGAAYRQRLLEFHPDRVGATGDRALHDQAEAITRRLSLAYQVLSNPGSRRAYNAATALPAPPR